MNFQTVQFLFNLLFVVSLSLFFVQCQDDPSREAAREAAEKTAAEATKAPPAEKPVENKAVRPPTSGNLTLNATAASAAKGEEVCVSVTAQDFRKIMSMQYSMAWDPEVLQFVNVKNFGLPGLTGNNFGGTQSEKGILTYSWYDANVQGISQPSGHKLYDVCFRATGEPGSETRVQFADAPVIIEITNAASLFLDLNGIPATVKVQ